MPDHLSHVLFNDGEGLDEADLNKAQNILDAKISERGFRVGGLAGVFDLDNDVTGNPNGDAGSDARAVGLSPTRIIIPDPFSFILGSFSVSAGGALSFSTGNMLIIQRAGAVAGTAPDGLGNSFGDILSYVPDDDELGESANARPTVNSRWDSFDVAISHTEGGAASRDFEDASTRALSTTTPNKDMERTMLTEYNSGAESATPSYPAVTAGYGRYLTVLRETAESSLTEDNVRLHAFPGKLCIEKMMGDDAWTSVPADFVPNAARVGALYRSGGAVGGTVYYIPKQVHEGARLVGVGVSFLNFTNDLATVDLVRLTEAAGIISTDSLLGLTPEFSTTSNGYSFAGLDEFVDAQGNELPIWGNGRGHGPLFSDKEGVPVSGKNVDRIALRISDAADWTIGDIINYVEFYYLE